jgi:outer membrane receptor protein involved in Fe transport
MVALADEDQEGVRIFPAEFFADAQARTAFDMIKLLPGFTFNPGLDDVRGYAGAAGNVLINAQRPASKFDELESVLERIPASAVERIELIRGTNSAVDMQGQLLVANVVRRDRAATELGAELGLYVHGDDRSLPEAKLDTARRWGSRFLSASLHAFKLADDDSGHGYRQRTDTAGRVTRHADTRLEAVEEGIQAVIGYEQPLTAGNLRLHTAIQSGKSEESERLSVDFPVAGPVDIDGRENYDQFELGIRFDRVLVDGSNFEFLAIQQMLREDATEVEVDGGDSVGFVTDSESGETILRGLLRKPLAGSAALESGAELVYNFLDSRFASEENGMPIVLPDADVRAQEYRAEIFASVGWDISRVLSTEMGLAYEISRISQVSDNRSSKTLGYLKPRIALAWTPSSADQVRMQLQRTVGQLDFNDFVSSAELSTGTLDVGNPDLEPESSWELTTSWERQLGEEATLVVGLRHARRDNVVDVIPIYADTDNDGLDEIFEGPGNLGRGMVNEVNLGLDLPLSGIGIIGGDLKGDLTWRQTKVDDPLTGEARPIAGTKQPWEGQLTFTQEVPAFRLRWGINFVLAESEPEYRLDETREDNEEFWIGLFADYQLSPAWMLSVEVQNLTSRKQILTRTLYDAPRDIGQVDAIDVQSRTYEPYLAMRVQWQLRD